MFSEKDIAAILYNYYLTKFLEDDFCYDDGEVRRQVENRYNQLTEKDLEAVEQIENEIKVIEEEGTDYWSIELSHPSKPNLFVQITSMIDFDGNSPEGYTGGCEWCDVGMFFVDYIDCDFENLDDKMKEV